MEKVKSAQDRAIVHAVEWVRRLAEETTACEIVQALLREIGRISQ